MTWTMLEALSQIIFIISTYRNRKMGQNLPSVHQKMVTDSKTSKLKTIKKKGIWTSGVVTCNIELEVTEKISIIHIQWYHWQRIQQKVLEPPSKTSQVCLWWLGSWPGHVYGFSTVKLRCPNFWSVSLVLLQR